MDVVVRKSQFIPGVEIFPGEEKVGTLRLFDEIREGGERNSAASYLYEMDGEIRNVHELMEHMIEIAGDR